MKEADLVYKKVGSATFAPRALAEWTHQVNAALWESKTWGEFRARMPADEFDEVMANSFDPSDSRPGDLEPFEPHAIEGVGDGDYPPDLAQSMHHWIPAHLLSKYAVEATSALNGNFWDIDEADADNLADELRALGCTVTEEPDLNL